MATSPAINTGKTRGVLIILMAFFMLFAAACGGAEAVTVDSASPATQTNNTEQNNSIEVESPEIGETNVQSDNNTVTPKTNEVVIAQPVNTTPSEPSLDAETCTASQFPSMGFAAVVNISSTDPDAGLNVRNAPGINGEKVGLLESGAVVHTGFHADERCAVDTSGAAWWYIYSGEVQGWVHTGYLAQQESDLPLVEDEYEADEPEQDAHFGDVDFTTYVLPTGTSLGHYVLIGFDANGQLIFGETPHPDTFDWARYSCFYLGDQLSCDVLAASGQDFATETFALSVGALEDRCFNGDPNTNAFAAMACEELALRADAGFPVAGGGEDYSVDCVTVPHVDTCVAIGYGANNIFLEGPTPDPSIVAFARIACMYDAHQPSCDVVDVSPADPTFNAFHADVLAATTDDVRSLCERSGLPANDAVVVLACAELATRG